MAYRHSIGNTVYVFDILRDLLAKASPPRSGDRLAGIAAASAEQMVAARIALADVPLKQFLHETVIPYETDEVTRLIVDSHDAEAFAAVSSLTVGSFRDWLLSGKASSDVLRKISRGLTPEMAAAVSKLMRNQDLILAARKCEVVTGFRDTIGLSGRMSVRLQPNHPFDDAQGITASILDGILLGAGDACIGINPASDDPATIGRLLHLLDEIIGRLQIPTQACVLSHVTTTLRLIGERVPVDLWFQSIAGTEAANRSFGVDLGAVAGSGSRPADRSKRGTVGDNVMYFETGQARPLRRCPPWCRSAGRSKPVPTPLPRLRAAAGQYGGRLHRPGISLDGKQIIRAGWKITSAANCSACPRGATCVTPTTPKPTRTTWTTC